MDLKATPARLSDGVRGDASPPPSPFEPSEALEYDKWRRRAWQPLARALLGDAAKCVRIVLPEEYDRVKKRFPKLADKAQQSILRRNRDVG